MRAHGSVTSNDLAYAKPYWNYGDISVFFPVPVLIGSILRVSVRFHLLSRSELNNPSAPLQFALIAFLSLALYLLTKGIGWEGLVGNLPSESFRGIVSDFTQPINYWPFLPLSLGPFEKELSVLENLFKPMHLLVILVLVLLIFGPKKLPELGKGLGEGIKSLKNSINSKDVK